MSAEFAELSDRQLLAAFVDALQAYGLMDILEEAVSAGPYESPEEAGVTRVGLAILDAACIASAERIEGMEAGTAVVELGDGDGNK